MNRIRGQGIPMVCAAGPAGDAMPAVLDGVIGVGGLRESNQPFVVIDRDSPVQAYARTWHPATMHLVGRRAPRSGVSLSTAYVAGLVATLPRSVLSGGADVILDALDEAWGATNASGLEVAPCTDGSLEVGRTAGRGLCNLSIANPTRGRP